MLDNIKYFLPTSRQCWVMVFYICVVGGIGLGLALAIGCSILGIDMLSLNPLITYVVPMIPVFLYILFKGSEIAKNNEIAKERGLDDKIVKAVPLSSLNTNGINTALLVILIALATIAAMILTEPLTNLAPMPEAVKEIYKKMLSDTLWTTLSVAVAAPLIEEFLLRGIMLRGLLEHTSPINAIHYSAFFFALIHMNLSQAIGAFLLGLFIGWVYYKTGSLWLAIFIHFINNGLGTLFTLAFPQDIELTFMEMIIQNYNLTSYIIIYIVSAITFGAIIRYLYKKLRNEQLEVK